MSAIITPVVKARKRYRCDWDCGSVIEPGQAYVRWALPPGHEWNTDQHWRSGKAHAVLPENCPTFIHGDPREEMQAVEDEGHRRWRAEQDAKRERLPN